MNKIDLISFIYEGFSLIAFLASFAAFISVAVGL